MALIALIEASRWASACAWVSNVAPAGPAAVPEATGLPLASTQTGSH